MDKRIENMLDYCKRMAKDNLTKVGDCLSVRTADGMLITSPTVAMQDMQESDILVIKNSDSKDSNFALHSAIYATRLDVNAIITNHAPYCGIVSNNKKKLVASLDDMAQIIGPTASVVEGTEQSILGALKSRNACLIAGGGVVAIGRSVDEVHTATLVLEKGARVEVEGTIMGKAIKIPLWEAMLMNFVYKKKYSKANQAAKMEEIK